MPSAFLCHSSKDKDFTRALAERLAANGVSVWIDEAELDIGDSLLETIAEGIKESDFVVVVISRNSVMSNWVRKELLLAMTREVSGHRVTVLPVVIDGCKPDIPFFLTDKLYADFSKEGSFDQEFGRVLRAIFRRHQVPDLAASGAESLGKLDVGSVVHDRGGDWIALQMASSGRAHGLRFLVMGLFVIVGCTLVVAHLPPSMRPTLTWFFIGGLCIGFAGLCMASSGLWLKMAVDVDKNILLQMEVIGKEEWNIFTSKWKEWFTLSKQSLRLRVSIYFAIAAYVLMLVTLICFAVVAVVLVVKTRALGN